MAKIINGRVRQKAAPLAEWQNSDLESLDGEQLFVRSDVDDAVIGFKFGAKGKKFSELPYPDLTVRDKATPSMSWAGRQSGVYIPTTNGNYNGININLSEGYQVLYWDGATVQKVVYPTDYTGAVFGGVIDDTYDLSTPPTDPTWYIASAGTYNTMPPTTLTETSILTWNGQSWSHIPFELEVRGEFLVADNIQEVRNITPEVAQLLVNGTYKGVTVLGYYEPDDTPGPINYYLSDTSESDDGGSVLEGGGIKLEHVFIDNVYGEYFGMSSSKTSTENIALAQIAIDYAGSHVVKRVTLPKYFRFVLKNHTVPINVSISSYGSTLEEMTYINNVNTNGTPVNEVEWKSPYHIGLILNTDDSNGTPLENHNSRMKSIVVRHNGKSDFQKEWTIQGERNHMLDYKGILNISVTSGSTSGGTVVIKANEVDYSLTIPASSSKSDIQTLIRAIPFSDDFTYTDMTGDVVRVWSRQHSVHLVRTKPTVDGDYSLTVDGIVYNVPVLASDTYTQIAVKISNHTPLKDKYFLYQFGAGVQIINKLGALSGNVSGSIVSNNTGASISTSITGYNNQLCTLVLSKDKSSIGKVGVNMWNARYDALEVADTFRIIADSDNNVTSGTVAQLTFENERLNKFKRFRLLTDGSLVATGENVANQYWKIKDNGWVESQFQESERFRFLGTTRDIRSSVFNSENAVFISNNAGSGFIIRISDANGIEFNQGGVYRPYQITRSGTTAQRPTTTVIGQEYFDTTLGKPVWWSGTNWVDATGTIV